MHRPPEGVQGARVTQLPSIKLVLKELSGRNAATTLDAGSLEKLLQRQAQVRVTCGAISPIPTSHTRPGADAARRGPVLLQGCLVSAAHFLQAGAKQLTPPVPSGSRGGRGHVDAGGTRRSRRRLPWPFAWPRTSAAAEAPGPSGSAGQGALFGRALAALCSQDGTLPQPIQDLLALLNEHGPSTEGIFRLAAGERASREIREALDSGVEVQLQSQPVLLLAVIFKDLLRKIPSKLLDVQLYEEWMSALQQTSRQERLAALREVASKLPEANLLLLRHLLSLLHNISGNVATSKMTARNLAICLGPNLLSPPQELPLDVLVQEMGKVTQLVEFLIDHHEELLGEEVAGLASKGDEEPPAPQMAPETAEVPPVALESNHQNSSSGERRCPFTAWIPRMSSAAWASSSTLRPQHHLGGGEGIVTVSFCSGRKVPPARPGARAAPSDPSQPSQEALRAHSSAPPANAHPLAHLPKWGAGL
ncbi:T-cell activation Rho GTPase-activating protein-like [Strigops habroptila]|uniref:T-cell activation Rho GTPase-activating protein-like n=1 Tax=Strigops habroptila TaxID=2489341 RepID=UPI0011CF80AC|nr:T-cell activation Rho GTPase-activating protein-like [Strigops habroptila]